MRIRALRFILFFLLICSVAVAQDKKILFIGNSLTYYNDLPTIFEKIVKQSGAKVTYTSLLKPNYGLEDYWIEGKAQEEIKNGHYDVVIFQQGPSSLAESRAYLVEYSQYFEKVCKAANTKMAFYMVWPSKDRFGDFPRVIETYAIAADTTHAILCPVGAAWLEAWKLKKDLPLYGPDNFHPSPQGTLLASLVIYGAVFNKTNFDFIQFEKLKQKGIPVEDFSIIRQAAQNTLTKK